MRGGAGDTEWLQVLDAGGLCRHGLRDVDQRLCRLSVRYRRDHPVGRCVDGGHRIAVLDADIDARAVSGRPDAMRQVADRNGRDLLEVVGPKGLHLVQPADRHIGKLSARRAARN